MEPATANRIDALRVAFFRLAAGGLIPSQWFEKRLPTDAERQEKTGTLNVEIVSHCWQYSHMLLYQLSSLVLYPPTRCTVTMTVYHSPEDQNTVALLNHFAKEVVPGVTWNWQALHRYSLFRRSIGRNKAAKTTNADWIWFTDCDLLFHENCLDTLSDRLQGSNDALVFPHHERTTSLLAEDDPLLKSGHRHISVQDIDTTRFDTHERTRATGPLQITHGDVARAVGYCDAIKVFQKPSRQWCKAHEDRAHRWLLQTQGTAIDLPGVYRIRHIAKGRYKKGGIGTSVRKKTRSMQSSLRGE